jgi:hypothetical protein
MRKILTKSALMVLLPTVTTHARAQSTRVPSASASQALSAETLDSLRKAHSTLPAALATITTDTGEFAPGHRDFTRYTDPLLCSIAAQNTALAQTRTLLAQARKESLRADPVRDTQPTTVISIARACGERFHILNTKPEDLPALFNLALRVKNDTLAAAILSRLLTLASKPAERTVLQLGALRAYLGIPPLDMSQIIFLAGDGPAKNPTDGFGIAQPANLAAANALMEQLSPTLPTNSSDVSVVMTQFQVQQLWLTFYKLIGDTAQVRHTAEQMLAQWHQIPASIKTEKQTWLIAGAGRALMDLAATGPIATFAARATAIARQIRQDVPYYSTYTVEQIVQDFVPDAYFALTLPARVHTPTFHADHWFAGPGGETHTPTRGKVSLWILLSPECSYDFRTIAGASGCWSKEATAVRQWVAQYGPHGLDVTVLVQTRGGSLWEGLVSPAREAERARWFVQDYYHLPVNVAVQDKHFFLLPQPDGRRFDADSTGAYDGELQFENKLRQMVPQFDSLRIDAWSGGAVVTDRDGTLQFAAGWNENGQGTRGVFAGFRDVEPLLANMLQQVVPSPPGSVDTVPSPSSSSHTQQ